MNRDADKPLHTLIALDTVMTALLTRISQSDRALSCDLIVDLANAIRVMPNNIRGAADTLSAWKEILQTPTNSEAAR